MHATLSTRDIVDIKLVRAFIYMRLKIHAPLLHATCNHPTIFLPNHEAAAGVRPISRSWLRRGTARAGKQ
jgi:hypothetical protein